MAEQWLRRVEVSTLRTLLLSTLLLVAVALYSWLIGPEVKAIRTMYGMQKQVSSGPTDDATAARIEKKKAELAGLRAALAGMLHNAPPHELESRVLGKLQQLSWDTGMELISVAPEQTREVAGFEERRFRIKLKGSYFHLYEWLTRISDDPPFLVLQKYELRKKTNPKGDALLDVDLMVASYGMVQ